jgi:RNA polymerase sigma-70 factor (ECF subfamily)
VVRTLFQSMNAPEEIESSPEELAQRSQAGCLESFEKLVRRYEKQIFNFLRQFTGNLHDAEDLTQETFVKAYRSLHRYKSSLAFAPWLFVIARRTAASHFRTADHFEELPVDSEAAGESPAMALEQSDEHRSLWKLVRELKPKQAEAVWLRYAEGFSVAETARIMSTNQVHIKVLLHRARSNLFKMLNARGMAPAKLKEQAGADRGAAPVSIKPKVVI